MPQLRRLRPLRTHRPLPAPLRPFDLHSRQPGLPPHPVLQPPCLHSVRHAGRPGRDPRPALHPLPTAPRSRLRRGLIRAPRSHLRRLYNHGSLNPDGHHRHWHAQRHRRGRLAQAQLAAAHRSNPPAYHPLRPRERCPLLPRSLRHAHIHPHARRSPLLLDLPEVHILRHNAVLILVGLQSQKPLRLLFGTATDVIYAGPARASIP